MQNFNQRCQNHDYRSRCYYMITMLKNDGVPSFSNIQLGHGQPYASLSPVGRIIKTELGKLKNLHPNILKVNHVVMPDHIHFLIFVSYVIPEHLGSYIGRFSGNCSHVWNSTRKRMPFLSLFKEGFNDRIVWREGQKDCLINYINDNPRRYWMKKNNPVLFRKYLHLEIGGKDYAAYGNIFLLRDFDRMPVIVHQAWSESDFDENFKVWKRCAENRGVLISPFISKKERDVRDALWESGCKFVRIQKEGLPERFAPKGKGFQLCAEGRLLIIAPWPENNVRETARREECLEMNEIARMLCKPGLEMKVKR